MKATEAILAGVFAGGGSGGGADIFEIDFSVTFTDEGSVATSNKTVAEIQAAQAAGKYIVAKCLWNETFPMIDAYAVYVDNYGVSAYFMQLYVEEVGRPSSSDMLVGTVISSDGGRWIAFDNVYALTPAGG